MTVDERDNKTSAEAAKADERRSTEPEASEQKGLKANLMRLIAWVQQTRPMRVLQQFSNNQGNLLAAGMSYQSLFAIFAAIWLAFSVAGIWLTSNQEVLDSLVKVINQAVPGLIGSNGVIPESALTQVSGTLGWTGIIAAVGLLGTAIGWLASTRSAVRAMFDLGNDQTNPILQKARDLGLAFGFGLVLIAAALVSIASTALLSAAFGFFGVTTDSFWVKATIQSVSFLLVVVLNTATLSVMFRVLSHVAIPFRHLIVGALIGSVALAILSTLSGLVLRGAGRNPLVASFAVIIGLLIWFNLVCRVLLISAAWIAVGMDDRDVPAIRLSPEETARQRAEEEYNARIDIADAAVDRAEAVASHARGFGRRRAEKKAVRARADRSALTAEDPASDAPG